MDDYKKSYIDYNGTDEGFDEQSIFSIATELYEMSMAGTNSIKSRAILIDTLPIAKARGFLVANTLIYT